MPKKRTNSFTLYTILNLKQVTGGTVPLGFTPSNRRLQQLGQTECIKCSFKRLYVAVCSDCKSEIKKKIEFKIQEEKNQNVP